MLIKNNMKTIQLKNASVFNKNSLIFCKNQALIKLKDVLTERKDITTGMNAKEYNAYSSVFELACWLIGN